MVGSLAVATRTGLAALRANPVRTLLATLGVVIGSASLVSILSVSDGVERFARNQVARQGFDRLVLRPITFDTVDGERVPRAQVAPLGVAEAEAATAALASGERAVLMIAGVSRGRLGASERERAFSVTGIALSHPDTLGASLAAGRFITPEESRAGQPVAVVGNKAAVELLGGSTRPVREALGQAIRIGDRDLRIIGVAMPDRVAGARAPMSVTVPFALAASSVVPTFGPRVTATLAVVASRQEDVVAMRRRLEGWLGGRDPGWRSRYEIQARAESQLAMVSRGLLIFRLLMGSITGITLIVGGIGIMNVLLASVAERTREIGVRKAVGAKRRDILMQFLAESVTITGAGSAIGTALGLGTAYAVTALMRAKADSVIYAAVTPQTILVSALAAIIVGIVFGSYPAARAARLTPIDAIRTE